MSILVGFLIGAAVVLATEAFVLWLMNRVIDYGGVDINLSKRYEPFRYRYDHTRKMTTWECASSDREDDDDEEDTYEPDQDK